jgi:hypothetical protein
MLEAHNLRKSELATEFGPPIKLSLTTRGRAEFVEAALAKQRVRRHTFAPFNHQEWNRSS